MRRNDRAIARATDPPEPQPYRHTRRRNGPWTFWERHVIAYLTRGGFWPDMAREIARGGHGSLYERDLWRYHLWLYDHRPGPVEGATTL